VKAYGEFGRTSGKLDIRFREVYGLKGFVGGGLRFLEMPLCNPTSSAGVGEYEKKKYAKRLLEE